MPNRRWMGGLILLALATGSWGCAAAPFAGGLSGTLLNLAVSSRGRSVEHTFLAPRDAVHGAVREALRDLGLQVDKEEITEKEVAITAGAQETSVVVTILPVTPKAAKVRIVAHQEWEWGRDSATARATMDQVATRLLPHSHLYSQLSGSLPQTVIPDPLLQRSHRREPSPLPPPKSAGEGSPWFARLEHPHPDEDVSPYVPVVVPPALGQQPPPGPGTDRDLFQAALDAYAAGRFSDAIRHLHSLGWSGIGRERQAAIHYWLGESFYGLGDYPQALLHLEMVVREFPKSPEVPRALLREVHTYRKLKNDRMARKVLTKLTARYPTSWEARLASDLLNPSH